MTPKFNSVMNCDKCKWGQSCTLITDCPYLAGWKDGQVKLKEWLNETCPHWDDDMGGHVTMVKRHACDICMRELEAKHG